MENLVTRLNKEKNGFNSTTKRLFRNIKRKKIDESISIKEQIIKVHKRWNDVEYWQAIQKNCSHLTLYNGKISKRYGYVLR